MPVVSISGRGIVSAPAAPQSVSSSRSSLYSGSLATVGTAASAASSSMTPNSVSGGREDGVERSRTRVGQRTRLLERLTLFPGRGSRRDRPSASGPSSGRGGRGRGRQVTFYGFPEPSARASQKVSVKVVTARAFFPTSRPWKPGRPVGRLRALHRRTMTPVGPLLPPRRRSSALIWSKVCAKRFGMAPRPFRTSSTAPPNLF